MLFTGTLSGLAPTKVRPHTHSVSQPTPMPPRSYLLKWSGRQNMDIGKNWYDCCMFDVEDVWVEIQIGDSTNEAPVAAPGTFSEA
jgi:hypothetical protein